MPPALFAITTLFHSIKQGLIAHAPRSHHEAVEREFDEWVNPFATVLEALWNATDHRALSGSEKEEVEQELRALRTVVGRGEVTVHNLPTLSSTSLSEILTIFTLSEHSLSYYLQSTVNLYLFAPHRQYELAEQWLEKAEEEVKELMPAWHKALIGQKKAAVAELARRYDIIRRVEPKERSAHLLASLCDRGIFPVLAFFHSSSASVAERSLGTRHHRHSGRRPLLSLRQEKVYGRG